MNSSLASGMIEHSNYLLQGMESLPLPPLRAKKKRKNEKKAQVNKAYRKFGFDSLGSSLELANEQGGGLRLTGGGHDAVLCNQRTSSCKSQSWLIKL